MRIATLIRFAIRPLTSQQNKSIAGAGAREKGEKMHITSNDLRRFAHFGLAVLALAVSTVVGAAPFTPGDVVVTRVVGGTGTYDQTTRQMTSTAPLVGGGTPNTVVLDEYTPTGTLV